MSAHNTDISAIYEDYYPFVPEEVWNRRVDLVELYFRRVKEQITPMCVLLEPESVKMSEVAGTAFGNLTVATNVSISFIAEILSDKDSNALVTPASLAAFLNTMCKIMGKAMAQANETMD